MFFFRNAVRPVNLEDEGIKLTLSKVHKGRVPIAMNFKQEVQWIFFDDLVLDGSRCFSSAKKHHRLDQTLLQITPFPVCSLCFYPRESERVGVVCGRDSGTPNLQSTSGKIAIAFFGSDRDPLSQEERKS